MRSSVFPDPAGAWTMKERLASSASRRCPRSPMASLIVISGSGDIELIDAAQRLQITLLARQVPVLGIDARVTRGETAPQRFDLAPPAFDQFIPRCIVSGLFTAAHADGRDVRNQITRAAEAFELHVSDPDFREGERGDVFGHR